MEVGKSSLLGAYRTTLERQMRDRNGEDEEKEKKVGMQEIKDVKKERKGVKNKRAMRE